MKLGSAAGDSVGLFLEVGGIRPEMDTEAVTEGGENRFVHSLPTSVEHPRLVLKRGRVPMSSPLVAWCKEVLEGGLGRPVKALPVHVSLLDEDGQPLRSWSLENAFPVKWQVDAFSSAKNELAVESIELAYRAMHRTV